MQAIRIKALLGDARKNAISAKQRSNHNSNHSTKLGTIKKYTPSRDSLARDTYKTLPTNKPPTAFSKVTRTASVMSAMNQNFLFMRKENHLNTCFNIRKTKLKDITKENKKIYQRINSQKSLYSSVDLNKSYESTREIKDRLSQSKLSHRSNLSHSSSRKDMKTSKCKRLQLKKQIKLQIKAKNINNVQNYEFNDFRALFIKDTNKPVVQNQLKKEKDKQNSKANSFRLKNNIIKSRAEYRKSVDHIVEPQQQGGLLHRIVQQMIEDKQNKKKTVVNMFKNKRFINF